MKLDGAICFSGNNQAFNAVKNLFRERNLSVVIKVSSAHETIRLLKLYPQKALIIDWSSGTKNVAKVLSQMSESGRVAVRPSLIISKKEDTILETFASDHGVTCVHIGEMTEDGIRPGIDRLFEELKSDLSLSLTEVAAARSAGDWDKAKDLVNTLEEEYPDHPRVILEVVENHLYFDEVDDALMYLKPLVEGPQVDIRVINSYARALMKAGQFEEASSVMNRANAMNPHNVNRLIDMGRNFLDMEWTDQAVQSFDNALTLDADNKKAALGKAQALTMDGNFDEAFKHMKESGSSREMTSVFNSSAIMAIRKGKYAEGMELYQLAAKAAAKDKTVLARVAFNVAIAYHRWRKPEGAYYYFSLAKFLDKRYEKAQHNIKIIQAKARSAALSFSDANPIQLFLEGATFASGATAASAPAPSRQMSRESFEDERI